jgi:hypothetical protein
MISPFISIASPAGLIKLPPEEIVVWSPVIGLTRIIPPEPPNASGSAMIKSPLPSIAIP